MENGTGHVERARPSDNAPDPRTSLQHLLAAADSAEAEMRSELRDIPQTQTSISNTTSTSKSQNTEKESEETQKISQPTQGDNSRTAANNSNNPNYTMTVVHTRRNANGTIGSVYSGNKISHLKKKDGEPFWRKDIQYNFLKLVFEDRQKEFTLEGDPNKKTFSEIYVAAMAKSSKTSKVLRDKLLSDHNSALNMAMVCLLVNFGRMNTTLNFFPEMRAQLRTYHAIPCLQLNQDKSDYKGLQDAPRLKSILKGACEDTEQPNTVEKVQAAVIPRTNPVNLIFVLSQNAPKVSETHFQQPRDFFDLVIRHTLSSKSRARAFLWLMWWYLESDFSDHAALHNPFGAGQPDSTDSNSRPLKVPHLEPLTDEQAEAENVDIEDEIEYGDKMKLKREEILSQDKLPEDGRGKKSSLKTALNEYRDDERTASPGRSEILAQTRSPSPDGLPNFKLYPTDMKRQSAGRLAFSKSKLDRAVGSSSPAPSSHNPFDRISGGPIRRTRHETAHQRAINNHRQQHIDKIMFNRLRGARTRIERGKREEFVTPVFRAMWRITRLPDDYDSDDENNTSGGGLVPVHGLEEDDFGAEALRHSKNVLRALRRLARHEGLSTGIAAEFGKRQLLKRARDLDFYDDEMDLPDPPSVKKRRGPKPKKHLADTSAAVREPKIVKTEPMEVEAKNEEGLTALDMDLLGEGQDDEDDGEDDWSSEDDGIEDENTVVPGVTG